MRLPWQKKVGDDGQEQLEITLPDELKTRLESAASKDEVAAIGSKFDQLKTSLDSIQAHFSLEAEERRREQARRTQQEQSAAQNQTEEQLNEEFLTNPVGTVKKLFQSQSTPTNQALLEVRADSLRRETFEDHDRFPFYTGEVKSEIDKLLAAQDLRARNDPSVIEHAYHSTVGRHYKELTEGKLKSRFAGAESTRGATAGKTGPSAEEDHVRPLDDDGKRIAKMLGFKEDEYAKMLHDEGVGMV